MISGGCSNMEVWPQFAVESLFVLLCGCVVMECEYLFIERCMCMLFSFREDRHVEGCVNGVLTLFLSLYASRFLCFCCLLYVFHVLCVASLPETPSKKLKLFRKQLWDHEHEKYLFEQEFTSRGCHQMFLFCKYECKIQVVATPKVCVLKYMVRARLSMKELFPSVGKH